MLRLMLVSDVHCSIENVRIVAKEAASSSCDAIIVTGDLAKYNAEKDGENTLSSEADVDEVLRTLETSNLPVYWLPGNHDPPACFDPNESIRMGSEMSRNIGGESKVSLAKNLFLCGVGGAVPAYQDGYLVWAGFPYSEYELGEKLDEMWSAPKNESEQYILLTHCGPQSVSTTEVMQESDKPIIESGSSNVMRLIRENHKFFILAIHGHTHAASGVARVGETTVVNPGALQESRYAFVTLLLRDERWAVAEISMKSIP